MKKKKGYKSGGVVGTTEYSQSAYKNGGIAKKKYQDGGIVETEGSTMSEKENESKGASSAKRNALKGLKESMASMGGNSLFDSIDNKDAYKDGGVVKASVIAKDKEGLKEGLKKASKMMNKYEDGGIVEANDGESEDSGSAYDDLSKEELIRLLKNK
jgi:hypothetical protein